MDNTIFNPDEFVFQKVLTPEDNPTLLEYDAKNGLILIRIINPDKTHEYRAVNLTQIINNNLLANIPDKWSNENDRILVFAIRQDGTYLLEKEKLKYDFTKKETTWISYQYKNLTLAEAKELFEAIKAASILNDVKTETEVNNSLLELAKKDFYLDQLYVNKRTKLEMMLRESDWRILPDAPERYEGEIDLWKKWREHLRTIVKKPTDFDNELDYLIYDEDFMWPINPDMYDTMFPNHDVEYLSTDNQFTLADVSITDIKHDILSKQINIAVQQAKFQSENGVPINREFYRIIERYKLLDGIENLNITPEGEE